MPLVVALSPIHGIVFVVLSVSVTIVRFALDPERVFSIITRTLPTSLLPCGNFDVLSLSVYVWVSIESEVSTHHELR